jgi:hypothetical protein
VAQIANHKGHRGTQGSQGSQEDQQLVLLLIAKTAKIIDHESRFTVVTQNRIMRSQRLSIVHQPRANPQTPERRRTNLVARKRATVLHNAIAGVDIVQKEITKRMNDLFVWTVSI